MDKRENCLDGLNIVVSGSDKPFMSFFVEYLGWLNLFKIELSLKRYFWGLGSQEIVEEGDCT